ncbi:MAG: VanW family protein [Lachnospiraceae bacterium]|jgi:vancomycin resistance protein YoaR|nr:VanW family protein [Lachnospiraceae bacterium]
MATNTTGKNGKTKSAGSQKSGSAQFRSFNKKLSKKKRRNRLMIQRAAIVGLFFVALVVCVLVARKLTRDGAAAEAAGVTDEDGRVVAETTEPETELQKEVMVDGIRITGMSRDEARAAILAGYGWGMQLVVGAPAVSYPVENLIENKVNPLLDEIFTGDKPKESYALDTSGLEAFVDAEVARLAELVDVPAQNGALSGFDKDSGSFIYSPESSGYLLDQAKLISDMKAAIAAKNFKAALTGRTYAVEPELTMAQVKELYKVIGSFTTKTTANPARNTNIQIACAALDGLVLKPDEEFSFNKTTGNRTEDKGYRPAGAYVNGVLVEEPGGGVCQVSSTLYNAVVYAGLKTVERHAHSYEPSYVTPGEDAMVSYDGYAGPDMKFTNQTKDTIAIRAKYENQTLTMSIIGIPVLESGVTLKMRSEKVEEYPPPEPTYEEDQSLELDVEVEKVKAIPGSKWVTNLVTYKDGEVVTDEFFHNSTYLGKPATILRNTSGVVVPKETESESTLEGDTAPEGMTDQDGQGQDGPDDDDYPGRFPDETGGGQGQGSTGGSSGNATAPAQTTSAGGATTSAGGGTTSAGGPQTTQPSATQPTSPGGKPEQTTAADGGPAGPAGSGTQPSTTAAAVVAPPGAVVTPTTPVIPGSPGSGGSGSDGGGGSEPGSDGPPG